MAYQSLYRRYRSQTFAQILGQPHVTDGLRSAVAEGRQGHAYLFSGPRGTGKTSTARVLAKALNCENLTDGEPCGICESCVAIESGKSFDLHELDAASHNKVDDVRDLISKVQLGSPGRTKVYILDEVHMLSSGAENALLKTLEEPPDHVVFVLATTEPQKVVATIKSRTQHFEFNLIAAETLAEHVRWVIGDAGLDVDDDGVDYVLRAGGGSARDTLSALELVAAAGGVPAGNDIAESLVDAVGAGDPAAAIAAVQRGLELGREPRTMGEEMLDLLRNAFLAAMGAPLTHLNDLTEATARRLASSLGPAALTRCLEALGETLVEMRQAPDPRVPFEVTLLRLTRGANPSGATATAPAGATEPADAAAPAPAGPGANPTGPGAAPDTGPLLARIEALEARIIELEHQVATGVAGSAAGATPTADGRGGEPRAPRPPRRGGGGRTSAARRGARAASATDGPADETAPAPPADAAPDAETDSPPPAEGGRPAPAEPASGHTLSLPAVTAALAERLDDLSQKVRARYKGGRIVAVDGTVVQFGAPNPIHRDRCAEVKGDVEGALSAHFGHPVTVEVVIDDASAPPPDPAKPDRPTSAPRGAGGSSSAPADGPPVAEEDEIGPIEELADASDQAVKGVDRITKAFPGSTVIDSGAE